MVREALDAVHNAIDHTFKDRAVSRIGTCITLPCCNCHCTSAKLTVCVCEILVFRQESSCSARGRLKMVDRLPRAACPLEPSSSRRGAHLGLSLNLGISPS